MLFSAARPCPVNSRARRCRGHCCAVGSRVHTTLGRVWAGVVHACSFECSVLPGGCRHGRRCACACAHGYTCSRHACGQAIAWCTAGLVLLTTACAVVARADGAGYPMALAMVPFWVLDAAALCGSLGACAAFCCRAWRRRGITRRVRQREAALTCLFTLLGWSGLAALVFTPGLVALKVDGRYDGPWVAVCAPALVVCGALAVGGLAFSGVLPLCVYGAEGFGGGGGGRAQRSSLLWRAVAWCVSPHGMDTDPIPDDRVRISQYGRVYSSAPRFAGADAWLTENAALWSEIV